MTTPDDELIAFAQARLAEDNTGRTLNFVNWPTLAAAWKDYKKEWALGVVSD
jgi:hypothetical protein